MFIFRRSFCLGYVYPLCKGDAKSLNYQVLCVKSVRIWSYSDPHFPAFGLNSRIRIPALGSGSHKVISY